MCSPKIFYFVIISVLFSACRPNYALLNEGYSSDYKKPLLKKTLDFEVAEISPKREVLIEHDVPRVVAKILSVGKHFPKVAVKDEKVKIPKFSTFSPQKLGPKPKPTLKEKQKKKRQRQRFWRQVGSNFAIGGFFLGIAIVLSLVHLQSLAAIFGLASILFLFFGMKKFFKKRKRQNNNPFKKKQ